MKIVLKAKSDSTQILSGNIDTYFWRSLIVVQGRAQARRRM